MCLETLLRVCEEKNLGGKMKFYFAIYENGDFKFMGKKLRPSQLSYHFCSEARIAEVEIEFDKLPKPALIFGKGIVTNENH